MLTSPQTMLTAYRLTTVLCDLLRNGAAEGLSAEACKLALVSGVMPVRAALEGCPDIIAAQLFAELGLTERAAGSFPSNGPAGRRAPGILLETRPAYAPPQPPRPSR